MRGRNHQNTPLALYAESNNTLFPLSPDIFLREREGIAKGWDRIGEIDAMLAPVLCSLGGIPFGLHR
jgi:hypothetical protein